MSFARKLSRWRGMPSTAFMATTESRKRRAARSSGEDVTCVMETEDGRRFTFGGKTTGGVPSLPPAESQFPPLHQMIAHYSFEGETAYGMIERSTMRDKMKMPG